MTWLVRGDCHGQFNWMTNLNDFNPQETSIIILGDVGLNFYLNEIDQQIKAKVNDTQYKIYCVRGNHEARPQDIPTMELVYDDLVAGYVYIEKAYPNIRYFKDYDIYTLNNYKCAVIGGAYSVDKYWRLQRVGITSKNDPDWYNPKKTGWFYNEQLSLDEMAEAAELFKGQTVDFVFTHTCPISWEPMDLFINSISQFTIDRSTEIWLDEIKGIFTWNIWCFGHFHADRLERPHVEQYFNALEDLDIIAKRWQNYDQTQSIEWWIPKSPQFYML